MKLYSSFALAKPTLFSSLLLGAWLAASPVIAQTFTNGAFFSGLIGLDGDISDFFQADGVSPKPGVCVVNDPNGLDDSPLSELSALDLQRHPSGFNQRRIMTAFNPNLNGGTIFVGIDLPGGTGADSSAKMVHSFPGNANPNYFDGFAGADLGGFGGRGKIVPFDADANGEADAIGRTGTGDILFRCRDAAAGDTLDIVNCISAAQGLTDNPRTMSGESLGALENYVVTLVFGNDQRISVELFQDAATPAGIAQLRIDSSPAASFGAMVSTVNGESGAVLGFDIEVAITNVNNAVADLGARLHQTIVVNSASSRDGAGQSDDQNILNCVYALPESFAMTGLKAVSPQVFQFTITNATFSTYTVLCTTNLSLPVASWNVVGNATTLGGGVYEFVDPDTRNHPWCFYRLRCL